MQRLMLLVVLLLGLCGCTQEARYKMMELHGLNCRPEALQNGACVSTAKRVSP